MEFHPGIGKDGKRYNVICIHPLDLDLLDKGGEPSLGIIQHEDGEICYVLVTSYKPKTNDPIKEVTAHGNQFLNPLGLSKVDLLWLGPNEQKELLENPVEFFSVYHPEMANLCVVSEKRIKGIGRKSSEGEEDFIEIKYPGEQQQSREILN